MTPSTPSCELASVAELIAAAQQLQGVTFVAKGAFKETFRVERGEETFALKIFHPARCSPHRTEREIVASARCLHKRIAKLEIAGIFSSGDVSYPFAIEEYFDGGTLAQKISAGGIAPAQVRLYGLGLADALSALKNLGLVHRDIKPDNIMFRQTDEIPVLVDLGLVRFLNEPSLTGSWLANGPGTPLFSAPEQLNNDKILIDWRSDQFSLGLVLGLCLLGRHPFRDVSGTDIDAVNSMGLRQQLRPEVASQFTSLGFPFLIKMLQPWPVLRFTSPGDLVNAINKPAQS